ncbi:MAG: AMP-binding protein [Calditrichae bacterium]|nr:AMP-binding protein [Calditrichia bacterium]
MIVSNAAQHAKVAEVEKDLVNVKQIVAIDPAGISHDKTITLEDVSRRGRELLAKKPDLIRQSVAGVTREDLATIIYTSGTTGEPKGVMLLHGNMLSNVEASLRALPFSKNDRLLSFLPLSHVFERMVGHFTANYVGATIAYAESIEKVVDNLQEVRPTVMASVPPAV